MAGFKIEGLTGATAEVNAVNQIKVIPETNVATNAAYVGAVRMFTENDPGAVTGSAYLKSPEVSPDYRLRAGSDTLLFNDTFNATIQSTGLYKHVFSTMTCTQGGGFVLFNANSSGASGNGAYLQTWRHFNLISTSPLYVEFIGQITALPLANQLFDFGLFVGAGAATVPADGVYFRYTSAGLYGILNYNGTETPIGPFNWAPVENQNYAFLITCDEREIEFWVDDVLMGDSPIPAGNGNPFITDSLPVCMQFRNPGLVTGSSQMQVKIATVSVSMADIATSKPWGHQMCGQGLMAYQTQSGTAQASTALASNSAPAAAAALVNISAAAGFQGLGGYFRVLPTLTAGTDGILCSYTNPQGGVTIAPRTLVITGVKLQSIVEVVLAGGPLMNVYTLCFGHTADSLATTETASFATATTKVPRRLFLGMDTYAANAALGTIGQPITLDLSSAPVVVNPGERIAIACRNMGTVTTTGNLLIGVTFVGYFE